MSNENENGFGQTLTGASFVTGHGTTEDSSEGAAEPVRDISTAEFMSEVIEASRDRPVLVDFWAPWCGPCKQLTPILEKAVSQTRGAVKLVKMNIDEHPQISGQMGIQSIPAVVAFVDGKPKDAFMGVQSEAEIKGFLEKLVGPQGPSPLEEALQQAEQLAASGDLSQAANLFAAVLQQDPQNADALAGMGSLYMDSGDLERAKSMLQSIPADKLEDPKPASLKAAIELAEQAEDLGDIGELEQKVEKSPGDHQSRFDLAIALNAAGRREEAADQLLEIMRRDRKWNDDGARTQLLQFFEAWGPADPATSDARRKLSSLLFS